MPECARISSRSPIDFIAAAVSTSPAVELRTIAAIIAAAVHGPGAETEKCVIDTVSSGTACSASGAAGGFSVSDGPWATKPTPSVIRAMPTQRCTEIGSCSQKRESSATITLPKAVAGSTKVRSAHESAVR